MKETEMTYGELVYLLTDLFALNVNSFETFTKADMEAFINLAYQVYESGEDY